MNAKVKLGFNDLCEGAVFRVGEEGEIEGYGSEAEVTVSSVSFKDDGSVEYADYINEDEYGEYCYATYLSETEFDESGCVVVSIPSEEDKANYKLLDNMLDEIKELSTTYNKLASTNKLDKEVVVLSDKDELFEWNSSRC